MTTYSDRDSLMQALAPLAPEQRAEILYEGENRSLVVSYGANVTFYEGNIKVGNSSSERFADINLTLIRRMNNGKPNGLGALGGRTDPEDHVGLDNPVSITKVTITREMQEELAELGIDSSKVDMNPDRLNLLELPIRDDNYILAKWSGDLAKGKNVTAVDPYCYSYKTSLSPTDVASSLERTNDGEVNGLEKISLLEALQCFGKKGVQFTSEDGRDLSHDYCYPHEYFVTWKIASDEIGDVSHKTNKMVKLAYDIQTAIYLSGEDYKIDFGNLARIMNVSFEQMDDALQLERGSIQDMQTVIDAISREEVLARRP